MSMADPPTHDLINAATVPTFAEALDPSTYNIGDFCRGYSARRHVEQDIAISASQLCRTNFVNLVVGSRKAMADIVTYENPTYGHIVTLLMPYTLPERLGLLSYLSEYFFLHDDQEDESDQDPNAVKTTEEVLATRKLARKQLLGELLAEMMAVNMDQAQSVISGLATYSKIAGAQDRTSADFACMEEYISFRYDDFASEFILASTMWGMNMDPLTASERTIMNPLIRAAFIAVSLTNDHFSYDVEAVRSKDPQGLMNGVAVLQRLHSVGVQEAKDQLRDLACGFDQDYLHLWQTARTAGVLTPKLDRLAAALSYQIVGKAIWSSTTLRYNTDYRRRRRADSVVADGDASAKTSVQVSVRSTPVDHSISSSPIDAVVTGMTETVAQE